MKKTHLIGLMLASLGIACASCSDDDVIKSGDGTGRLALRLDVNTSVISSRADSRADDDDTPAAKVVTVDDLTLKVSAAEGGWALTKKVTELGEDGSVEVPVGAHTIEAYFGNDSTEGFDKPYIYGSEQVTVGLNEEKPVGLTAKLQSAMLSITFDAELEEFLENYSIDIASSLGNHIAYAPEHMGRAVYLKPGRVSLSFTTKLKSSRAEGDLAIGEPFEVLAGHHHRIHVGYSESSKPDQVSISVTFDDTFTQADKEITIDVSYQALLTPVPEIMAVGFTPGEPIKVARGAEHDPIDFNILAMGGIDEVIIETENREALPNGWEKTINLTNLSAADQAKYTGMGLEVKGLWNNRDKMAVVRMAEVLKRAVTPSTEGKDVVFTITVRSNNKVSEPMKLVVKIVDQYVELSEVEGTVLRRGQNKGYTLNVEYPGKNPADMLTLSYLAKEGYSSIDKDKVTYEPAGTGKFTAKFDFDAVNLPDMEKCEFKISLNGTGISSNPVSVNLLPSEEWSIEAYDIYAKHGYLKITELSNGEVIRNSADIVTIEGNYTQEVVTENGETYLKLTKLDPNTEYTISASLKDVTTTHSVTFTTEVAAQLPNSGMEDWYSEKAPHSQTLGYGADAIRWFANAQGESAWATRNALTTSTSSGPTPNYVSFSGTVSTTGANGKAAEISTLGYGEGSTFTFFNKPGGYNKHIAAGMLFLGKHTAASETEETFEYGYPFTSRPSSFSFDYKYAPYNNEKFKAYIVIENREGDHITELGRGELTSGETVTSFKTTTVNVTYTNVKYKATHIYVVFISSISESPEVQPVHGSVSNFNGNTDSKRIGSILTVDNIILNY